ncbi:MAG: NYN domain-containing protein, partial [Lachnospiraceae bacterium]|nr:NYN domain-containing protein [Lachnospiraceae bacterium]
TAFSEKNIISPGVPKEAEPIDWKEEEKRRRAYDQELQDIFLKVHGPMKERPKEALEIKALPHEDSYASIKPFQRKDSYLLVDGYNMVFSWPELKELSEDLNAAREKLMDILVNYAGASGQNIILVFDAYKVSGGKEKVFRHKNIDVIYTKEAETADQYIERAAHQLSKKHDVTVATSDNIEQIIVFGAGAVRLSAKGLLERIREAEKELKEYLSD